MEKSTDKDNIRLKERARAILDVGNFIELESLSKDAPDEGSIGLFSVHRFTFCGDDIKHGQIQQVISIAPGETLEFVSETVRRTSREDEYESTLENTSERSIETKDVSEISDLVTKTLTETSRTSTSLNVSATCEYVSGDASQSSDVSSASTTSSQHTAKTVKEATIKSADRMKRSQRIKIRNVLEVTERNSTRRLIVNSGKEPINIAARSVLRQETVVAQRIDLQLCVMKDLEFPGELLRTGKTFSTFARDLSNNNISDMIVSCVYGLSDPYGWVVERGLSVVNFDFVLPINKQYNVEKPIELITYYIESGDNPPQLASPKIWKKDVSEIFDFYVSETNEKEVKIALSMRSGQKELDPGYFKHGASFHFTFRIPLKYSSQYVMETIALKKDSLDDLVSLSKRSKKDLRDEERAAVLGAIKQQNLPYNSFLDYSSAWYEIPEPKAERLRSDKEKNNTEDDKYYDIPGVESPARPFGAGLKGEWGARFDEFTWDADAQRFRFFNASSIKVFIPILPGHENETISKFGDDTITKKMANYITKRRAALAEAFDSDGDKLDAGDIPHTAKTFNKERWQQNEKNIINWVTDARTEGKAVKLTAEDFFPVVDRFFITTPIEGLLLERIDSASEAK